MSLLILSIVTLYLLTDFFSVLKYFDDTKNQVKIYVEEVTKPDFTKQ